MSSPPWEELRRFASPGQWQKLEALIKHGGNVSAAARELDIERSSLRYGLRELLKKAARQGYAPDFSIDKEVPAGLTLKGTSIRYNAEGKVEQYWNKTKVEGRDAAETVQIPDPKKIVKTSTLYDQEGRVTQQWVSEKPEERQREQLWRDFAQELAHDIPAIPVIPAPDPSIEDLLACYPVGDHHLGMLSWKEETGANYDIAIAEQALMRATDYLVAATPPCKQALIVFLGDFMHYDSFDAVTPTNRNLLDADGRYPKMVRAAVRAMRYLIEVAARRHEQIRVIVEIGNHDLSSSIFLMECLDNVYEANPRIEIDMSPAHYHYYEFGTNLIGTHHGHGTKMDRLPLIMAADRPESWGRSKYRYWYTGHVHHSRSKSVAEQSQDFTGCSVESFRVLAPVDAWAAQKGYRGARDQKALVLHHDYGEVARHTISIEMCLPKGDL